MTLKPLKLMGLNFVWRLGMVNAVLKPPDLLAALTRQGFEGLVSLVLVSLQQRMSPLGCELQQFGEF